ncbi:methyltransferase, partial [Georgenia sp. 10Sc9-8]|nr:methyltransferase [Georgenia halotolerans]
AEERELEVVLRGRTVRLRSAAGVFSAGGLDLGTRVLLDRVGDPPATGVLADVGCGWGPVAVAMAQASPGATVWAVDVNERAVDLTARNAAALGLDNVRAAEATRALPQMQDQGVLLDEIWSNPPVRIGKSALHDLLRSWLARLAPTGQAHLVVQRNLGADSLHRWLESALGVEVTRTASAKGYRVLTARPAR